jgi:hypothetical protein
MGLMDQHWIVAVRFRCADERQRSVIDGLGPLTHDVVGLWLQIILPEAQVAEYQDRMIRHVAFPTRAQARRFIATWGGKMAENR